ncbi:MAG TPA: hypothetical protein VF590_22345 [Isosphaeraceae bacterium]|jgi:hypothetical protein
MTNVVRPWTRWAGGLLIAAAAGGSATAQDVLDMPALAPPSAAPALPALAPPATVAALPPPAAMPTLTPPPPAGVPVAAPVAGEIRIDPAPVGMIPPGLGPGPGRIGTALPPPPPGGGRHEVQPPCDGDRQTRRLWRRYRCQDRFLGYPEEFVAPPLGASLYANNRTQVANAEAARMVLYDYDFVEGSNQLTQRGLDQLNKILARLPLNFFPLIIERTPRHPGLDETRRLAVLSHVARSPFPIPSERVIVGAPIATGINGEEAQLIDAVRLGRTAAAGPPISTGGSFTSSGAGGGGSAVTGTTAGAGAR